MFSGQCLGEMLEGPGVRAADANPESSYVSSYSSAFAG